MRKLIVLLLALASTLAHASDPGAPDHKADDAKSIIKACGKPQQDRVSLDKDGTYVRDMVYRDARIYLKGKPGGPWTINSGYSNELKSMTTASGVAQVMPCLKNLIPPDAKPGDIESKPFTPQSVDSQIESGSIVTIFLGSLFVLILVIAMYGRSRAWKNRPTRLCTNCYTTAQPLQHKNKRWYCGHCGADNPVPLDSPLAVAFREKQQNNTNPELPR